MGLCWVWIWWDAIEMGSGSGERGWNGVGWDGMGWDGVEECVIKCKGWAQDGIAWDGIGWDRKGVAGDAMARMEEARSNCVRTWARSLIRVWVGGWVGTVFAEEFLSEVRGDCPADHAFLRS